MDINGKWFCLTGGGGSLGKAIIAAILSKNGKVVILDQNVSALQNYEYNKDVIIYECDITNTEKVDEVIFNIFSKNSTFYGLINNAGIIHSEPLYAPTKKDPRHSLSSWHEVLKLNLTSPMLLASYFVQHMWEKRVKGIIINVSSVCAGGNAGQSAYSASKAGLEALSRVWAKELGPIGIRSVAVAPGFIEGQSTLKAMPIGSINGVINDTPLKMLGSGKDVAGAILLAIENDFMTGNVISVDGGYTL